MASNTPCSTPGVTATSLPGPSSRARTSRSRTGWNSMSRRPIDLSPDLLRLQNEGYDIVVRDGFLLVRSVPYVDASRSLQRGTLISKLKLTADKTEIPDDHVAYWTGSHPCHADGSIIA